MRPTAILAIGITIFVVIAAVVIYSKLGQPAPPQQIDISGLPLPQWAISFGKADAPITIIELYDLHCPYCAMAHGQLDPLYRRLLDSGKLRLVFLDLIVHPDALQAHQYLHCAYRQLGNKTYDLITQLYRLLAEDGVNGPKKQLELLQQYKCDNAPSKAVFDNAVYALLRALAQKGVSISQIGTPTFIIVKNGTVNVVVGADVARVVSLISR